MFEPTTWIMTVILMYQPAVSVHIYQYEHPSLESCMAQREVALEAYRDDDPATHVVIGCEPRMLP
jgi:hypothetical protein